MIWIILLDPKHTYLKHHQGSISFLCCVVLKQSRSLITPVWWGTSGLLLLWGGVRCWRGMPGLGGAGSLPPSHTHTHSLRSLVDFWSGQRGFTFPSPVLLPLPPPLLCSSSSPVDRKHYIMLLWEMPLLLGYHQLTPCSIFRRMPRDGEVGEGKDSDGEPHGGHNKLKMKDQWTILNMKSVWALKESGLQTGSKPFRLCTASVQPWPDISPA